FAQQDDQAGGGAEGDVHDAVAIEVADGGGICLRPGRGVTVRSLKSAAAVAQQHLESERRGSDHEIEAAIAVEVSRGAPPAAASGRLMGEEAELLKVGPAVNPLPRTAVTT